MILGNITGKTTTREFKFLVKAPTNKFQYVQIFHDNQYILAQINEIEKTHDQEIAYCQIIGYRKDNALKQVLSPFQPNTEVLQADDNFIEEVLNLKKENKAAYFGNLDGYDNLKIHLDLNKLLTKHVAILAKSGSGKSYTSGVLVEEILEKEIPLLIIDPHGEYSTLKFKNDKDQEKLIKYNIQPKAFNEKIQEYTPNPEDNPNAIPLKLNYHNLTPQEIIHILPAKLSNNQLGLLYSALKETTKVDFNHLILELEMEENNVKYSLINLIKYIEKLNLFSDSPTSVQELIQPGKCSIINLRGCQPELQEVIVYKLMKDLFEERKKGNIPPFFAVVEEAHNFLPERSFGEAKSSAILRQVASEGRKFGLGLCIISQRPSRVDKSVLSQCNTQIILKVTNPNDVRAITNSVEGVNFGSEKEIQNLSIGTAMIAGVIDLPLFVNVRPRMTKHGGEAVDMLNIIPEENNTDEPKNGELLQLIYPNTSLEDVKLLNPEKEISTNLIPCLYVNSKDFNLLVNLNTGDILKDIEKLEGKKLTYEMDLSPQQKRIFTAALLLKEFTPAEIFAKTGVQFSDIYDIIQILTNKGYFIKEDNKLKISQSFVLNFEEYSFYGKPDFFRIESNNKLEKKFNPEEIKSFLSNFLEIKNSKECWLVNYS